MTLFRLASSCGPGPPQLACSMKVNLLIGQMTIDYPQMNSIIS